MPWYLIKGSSASAGCYGGLYDVQWIGTSSIEQQRRERGIKNQDGDGHKHHSLSSSFSHALSPSPGLEAHVNTDQRNGGPEDRRFGEAIDQVPGVPEQPGSVQKSLQTEPLVDVRRHVPRGNTDETRDSHQKRQSYDAGE